MTDERRVIAERRTLALRGPGAGGFTPAQSLSAANPCLNCGTNIQLEYCPECGQREIDSDPTLREFLHELAQEVINWDGKVMRSFRLLFTKPGFLTEEYLAGKRVRYITPPRLYLTCSVVFFFLATVIPRRPVATPQNALYDSLFAAMPKAMFVLLPAFAWLVALAFRDRRRRFPQHLAFALHVHALFFAALAVLLVQRGITNGPLRVVIGGIVGAAVGMYLLLAARRVYGGTSAGVLARLVLVFSGYAVALMAVLGVVYTAFVLTR